MTTPKIQVSPKDHKFAALDLDYGPRLASATAAQIYTIANRDSDGSHAH
jgi:hypothetical protein